MKTKMAILAAAASAMLAGCNTFTITQTNAFVDDDGNVLTVQEKLSLVARFGVTIGYFKPSHQEYLHIVSELAKRYPEITLSEQELALLANQWELRSGGASGRTAQQFINYLVGSAQQRDRNS